MRYALLAGALLAAFLATVAAAQTTPRAATRQEASAAEILKDFTARLDAAAATGDVEVVSALLKPATQADTEMIEATARLHIAMSAARFAIVDGFGAEWSASLPTAMTLLSDGGVPGAARFEGPHVIVCGPQDSDPAFDPPARLVRVDGSWRLEVSRASSQNIAPEGAALFATYQALGFEEALVELRAGRMGDDEDPWAYAARKGLIQLVEAGPRMDQKGTLERLRQLQTQRMAERKRRAPTTRPVDDAPPEPPAGVREAMRTPVGAARAFAKAVEGGDVEQAAAIVHGDTAIARDVGDEVGVVEAAVQQAHRDGRGDGVLPLHEPGEVVGVQERVGHTHIERA